MPSTRYIGRDLRVLLVTGDAAGCAYYRMELPAAMAATENLPVEISSGLPGREGKNGPEVNYNYVAEHYDVVVIQRPLVQVIHDSIPVMQAKGITVIIEIDDDFTALHPRNQAYRTTDPNSATGYNRDLVKSACGMADHVIVTTPHLVTVYGMHGRVSIIPNFIPSFLLKWAYIKWPRVCGWTGAISTHPGDLEMVGNSVALAIEEARAKFVVIGVEDGVKEALKLRRKVPGTGWLPVSEYYGEIGKLQVGIVPLQDSYFNRGKSNLKGLEFAATGVPFVASPLPEYAQLHRKGAGLLAHTEREWFGHLVSLLSDDGLRRHVRAAGKQTVEENYTLERNWHLWPEAWERAWKYKRNFSN